MRRQHGFTVLVYALAGLAVLAALSGIAYKIRQSGYDACTVERDGRDAKAAQAAEADRARQQQLSQTEAARLETALAKQRRLNGELLNVVEGHIKAARFAPECRLTPELVRDWDAAGNPSAKDASGRVVPGAGGTVAPANRPVDGRDAAKPLGGG